MISRMILSLGVLFLGAGAAQAQAVAYLCPGFGGVDVRVTLIEGTDAAIAEFLAGADSASGGADPVTLRSSRPGGDGFLYAGGDLVLSGIGDQADLTAGDVTVQCGLQGAGAQAASEPDTEPEPAPAPEPAAAPVPEPEPQAEPAPVTAAAADPDASAGAGADDPGAGTVPAVSLGGNLRDGPGTDFADIGGLDAGTPIGLLNDTGIVLNGYTWWEIEQPGGQTAFQWGGVICVPGGGVSGVVIDAAACGIDESGADGADGVDAAGGASASAPATALAPSATGGFGIAAISLGGNLRAGPGTAFPDVGDLTRGTPIMLLTDTGITFDGFSWWEILQPDGQIAFQWGGVICVPDGGVGGVAETCE